jgi:hypothetical protein
MDEILNNLLYGEVLYTTSNGTQYLYMGRSNNFGIVYSINQEQKTLPLNTINAAFEAFNLGEEIDAQWYTNYNQYVYESRPCNLSVLNELLNRI